MHGASVRFTETEYRAFELLFNAITPVLGEEQYRLVDPARKVSSLFACAEECASFVERLVGLNLIELLFERPGGSSAEAEIPTYRASQNRWLELGSAAERIPDPPLATEEKQLREALQKKVECRDALVERKEVLERELAKVKAEIGAVNAEIEKVDAARSEILDLRRRVSAIISAA